MLCYVMLFKFYCSLYLKAMSSMSCLGKLDEGWAIPRSQQ